ncbi:MAG TPA: carboxypeptidase regulatory-like domain-containing protein [Candidatus Acidoferrum sp.]|nr:carboxypeptidase regulatory-like domain-containing protein [Candidatus Acidoferrum sp.]
MKAFHSRSILLLLAVLCLPLLAGAQDTGYIGGTVIDKTGAAIAGAEITIKNLTGSLNRSTISNGDGAYVIPGLPGDTYDMTVSAKGFQKFTARKIALSVGEKARIDVSMTVGAVTEEVVVTGESVAQVETTSSEIGSTISGKQVSQLELNGRNFTQLVTLTPGVVNQTGQDEGKVGVYGNVAYSINGGRTEYNNWELDGGDNLDNGSNSTLNVYPNVEAIAEFKVLTSTYGAQYGRNGSGTIEVETKSGGSSFHGSAFEYLRNDFFNANEYFDNASGIPRPAYKKHDYGYTIGGPVYIPKHYNSEKKKTFFFFSEEWRSQKDPYTSSPQNVPSDAERGGDFTDVCTPATADCPNVANFKAVPITPEAQALLNLIPHANTTNGNFKLLSDGNGPATGAPIPAFIQTVSLPTTWREELVRIDHNITNNYRLTFRYIHDSWSTITPNPLWGNGNSAFENIQTNFVGPGTSFVARLNANITPTLLNEFVASYTADHISLTALNSPALPSGFAMGAIFNNGFGGKLPAIQLNGNAAYGTSLGQDTGYFPWNNANPTYTYRDNVTKIIGNHTFQFGAYAAFAQKNEDNSPNVQGILTFDAASGVTSGNSFADLLLGNIGSYKQWNQILKYYNRYKIVEPYFNDDWRVTKRLTLNLGLRMSLFGTYRERYRNAFNFNPDTFVAGNEPGFNGDGSLNVGAGSGNPLNGIVQCGGKGGNLTLLPGSAFPTVAVGSSPNDGCLSGHLFNPAPRIGFAFDPKGDGKLAIRGGYGVFFEHTNGNEGNTESLEGSAPLVLAATQSNITGYQNVGAGAGAVPLFPLTVVTVPNKAVWPYVQQWNLNVQKELPSHTIVSVAYVGSKGTHLTLLTNGNQILPTALAANPYKPGEQISQPLPNQSNSPDCGATFDANGVPTNAMTPSGVPITGQAAVNLAVAACGANADILRSAFPGFSNITKLRDEANSIYHALQVGANRTVGDLTLSVAYTYSHSIDDSSDRSDTAFVDSYNVKANRGNSTFDQRHNLTLSYVYGLPFFRASGFTHNVLGGWQISGITTVQTGTPFSITNGSTFGDNAGVANGAGTGSRPDLVGDPHGGFTSNQDPSVIGPLFYNPNAFSIPTGLTFGNVGRDTLFNPRRTNFDFGLFKRFTINEKTGFDFRWETFDLFNHPEFNSVSSSLGASDFLHVNGAHLSRKMQFGLRFYF